MNSRDCVFVVDWLNTKDLHKLCSVFEGVYDRGGGLLDKV